jgi:guanosine-3',5'-bis(diphosphate) 3'-pyrophosphohydrolase
MVKQEAMGLVLKALRFAAHKHRDQRRKDKAASPYINHPIALAETLWSVGKVRDPETLAAALLHDTIEDTQARGAELTRAFGHRVAGIVAEVTDDKRLRKQTRKRLQIEHAPHLSKPAKLVKLADKISNLADIVASPPADWPLARRQQYFEWAHDVVSAMGRVNKPMEQRFAALYRKRLDVKSGRIRR